MRPLASLVLIAVATHGVATAHAQAATTTREGGYEIKKWQTAARVPLDSVGIKTTDYETRVGVTPETDGNSRTFAMTIGGFFKKCPTAEGIVPGDMEYSLTVDEVNTDEGETQRPHYSKRANAKLEAQLRDDLTIDYIDIDYTYTSNMNGVRTGPVHDRRRFKLDQAGAVDKEDLKQAVLVTGDLAVAALMWNARMIYEPARTEWMRVNACVELDFDPPTETRSLGPHESAQVRTVLRTKDGKVVIDKAEFQGGPLENIGSLDPRKGQIQPDSPLTFAYTASAKPRRGNGFDIAALSRAGQASAEWRIQPGHDYELHFESTIVSRDPVQAARSQASGSVTLTGSNKPWRLRPDGNLYRLYDGKGVISVQTTPLPGRDPCDPLIAGSSRSELTVVDTYIQITPPSEQSGVKIGGKADVQMAYGFSMGAGETETTSTMVNYKCVPGDVFPHPFWWTSYLSGREPSGEINFLKNWEYIGRDGVVAKKTLRGTCGGLCDEEVSVFTLKQVESPSAR